MELKQKIIQVLDKAHQAEQEFIAGLSEAERNATSTLEQWSAKDVIAHCATWKKRLAGDISAASRGQTPAQVEDIDRANAEIYTECRDLPWEAILTLGETAHQLLTRSMENLKEQDLRSTKILADREARPIWRRVVGNGYIHPMLHLVDLLSKRGQPAAAPRLYEEMASLLGDLDPDPEWQGLLRYNLACGHSLAGDKERAILDLGEALRLNPSLIEWSKQDPDFKPIREEAGYKAIYKE